MPPRDEALYNPAKQQPVNPKKKKKKKKKNKKKEKKKKPEKTLQSH